MNKEKKKLLKKIEKKWLKRPDLSFGELLYDVLWEGGIECDNSNIFYLSDKDFLDCFKKK